MGLKFDEWLADEFNVFDLIIVIASIVEMFIISQGQGGVISVLRAFRLIRLIKLARSNVTLRCLIDSIAATVKAIGNFMVIMAIFIYVFSLLGMQLFAGRFKFDNEGYYDEINGKVPRTNFDGLLWSIITVFQIMVGDEWNQVMYKAYLAVSPNSVGYFIVLVLLGKIILLNLFLAILLGNFEQESLVIRGMMEDQVLEKVEK
jgi:voltage-dependent calcium channel L type alpha-1D